MGQYFSLRLLFSNLTTDSIKYYLSFPILHEISCLDIWSFGKCMQTPNVKMIKKLPTLVSSFFV